MKSQTYYEINPVSLKSTITRFETPYKIKKYNNIVVNFLWWCLHKMNALEPFSEEITTWTYTEVSAKRVNDELLKKAITDYTEYAIYESSPVILIGGMTFQELTHSPTFNKAVHFKTGPFGEMKNGIPHYFDVPICVVPSMSGIAVVPKNSLT